MDFSSFFDYFNGEANNNIEEMVFLPNQTEDDWKKIFSYANARRFQSGEILIQAGELDRSFYIITQGSLEVVFSPKIKSFIESGSIFGEQSFLDGKPRSATVHAVTDGEMLIMSLDSFEILSAKDPALSRIILFDLARILSIRLRQTTSIMLALA